MRRLAFPLTVLAVTAFALYSTASGDSPAAGNGFYRVSVEDRTGRDGLGVFTIATGPSHPDGDGREILFSEDAPGDAATSYITVRSYTTGIDYVQTRRGPGSGNMVTGLDPFGLAEALPTGYRATYDLAAGNQPDPLLLESKLMVSGASFDDTVVHLSTTLTNTGDFPLTLGVRYLLDVAPFGDDGPLLFFPTSDVAINQESGPFRDPELVLEGGSGTRIARAGDVPVDAAYYAYWPDAFEFAWDYTPRGREIAADGGLNDAALLYYFGSTRDTALRLDPGDHVTVEMVIRGGYPPPHVVPATPTPTHAGTTPAPSPTPLITPAALPRTGRR